MKFKVGDRVAFYGLMGRLKATVHEILVDEMLSIKVDGDNGCIYAHPKQCRKLIKKERIKLWVEYTKNNGIACVSHEPIEIYSGVRIVEFVEVRKKK